jgi:hypothetical protein
MWSRVVNTTAYAIMMAYLESAIVVYLRRLYYPQGLSFPLTIPDIEKWRYWMARQPGFDFPLAIIDVPTLLLELGREAATMVMLATVGIAAGRTKVGKFAYFLFLFGVWDIWYYIWLKVFLGWPPSLLTWDVLFLIPVPWVGPVLAPVTIALTMMGMGLVMLYLEQRGPVLPAGKTVWFAQIAAALIVFVSFIWDVVPRLPDNGALLAQWTPASYRWWMLLVGQALAIGTFIPWAWRASSSPSGVG